MPRYYNASVLSRDVLDALVARACGDACDVEARERLAAFVALVDKFNAKMDLTAARGAEELVDLLLADALALAAHVPKRARVIDVGSGAGAPGLALAIARPDVSMTLVEPKQKRVSFLRTAIGSLALSPKRVIVERATGEEIAARGATFDVAMSRATLKPPEWAELASKLAPSFWVLLAREEPPASPFSIADDVRYAWPLTGAQRRAVRFAR